MAEVVVALTADMFSEHVGSGTWVVDFWAAWCAPCQALLPVLEQLAAETDDARIAKVEVTEEAELAQRFGVTSLPTIILFRDGEPVRKLFGPKSKAQLLKAISEANAPVSTD